MDSPLTDGEDHCRHRLHRRPRHALAEQLSLEVSQGAHLEVIAQERKTRLDVLTLECIDVDHGCLSLAPERLGIARAQAKPGSNARMNASPTRSQI